MALSWKAAVGNAFLFFLIYGLSATVDFSNFKTQIKNKRAIGTGIFLQFIILPLLGFLVVKVLDLDEIYGVTLLIITSSPGGAYSNWFCSMFNADLALSVTMTAISTILSIAMLPLNVFIYSRLSYGGDILSTLDWEGLAISLAVVITAITSGLFSSYYFDKKYAAFRGIANKIGNLSGLGLILFSFLAPEGGRVNIGDRPLIFYLATPAPIVLGLLLSVIISTLFKLRKQERVTASIECCYQNTGIAITSCLTIFSGEDQRNALGVPFFYTGMQTLIVGLFCLACWQMNWTYAPRSMNFFEMLLKTHQEENEKEHIQIETPAYDEEKNNNEEMKHEDSRSTHTDQGNH